ncbi:uncharacterized protein BX663DRAFT_141008 [Cokeromyces recurvatus]|uniref:uncharacterized protein n=1 Tax=Cokeromyces recurvatus TaxID=90255 RepID=UPI00222009BF|nr:uncharacterized protein BX663DRAFT_141008 [Cokeromyces recurvatus]KAI7900971.1 hypothetical protein BX663DRAFT_141008 [Cokeromyces recurvatus]
MYPVESVTDYDRYAQLKSSRERNKKRKLKYHQTTKSKRIREQKHVNTIRMQRKGSSFILSRKKGMSVRASAMYLNTNVRTA